MAKRIRNRKELREQYDAAERQEAEGEETEEKEEEEEDEDDDEEEEEGEKKPGEEAGEEEDEEEDEAGDDDDEDAPRKKKKKAKPPPKPVKAPAKKSRARTPKIVRLKVIWGVFNNSNTRVATYEYPKRKDAYDHAARLTEDKKQGHPFFVQPVKEPIEEKKEDKKEESKK